MSNPKSETSATTPTSPVWAETEVSDSYSVRWYLQQIKKHIRDQQYIAQEFLEQLDKADKTIDAVLEETEDDVLQQGIMQSARKPIGDGNSSVVEKLLEYMFGRMHSARLSTFIYAINYRSYFDGGAAYYNIKPVRDQFEQIEDVAKAYNQIHDGYINELMRKRQQYLSDEHFVEGAYVYISHTRDSEVCRIAYNRKANEVEEDGVMRQRRDDDPSYRDDEAIYLSENGIRIEFANREAAEENCKRFGYKIAPFQR